MNRRLLAILALALLIRIPFLQNPLWGDELVTIRFLERYGTVGLLTEFPLHQPHFPLYYVLIDTFGLVSRAGRVVSLVASLGLVHATYVLGHKLRGETTAVYAAVLVSLSPVMVLHGTWLRM